MFSRPPFLTIGTMAILLTLLFIHMINCNAPLILRYYVITIFTVDSVLLVILLCYLLYVYYFLRHAKIQESDYLLVLGTNTFTKRVSPVLQDRLDMTIAAYHRLGDYPMIIVSGGRNFRPPLIEDNLMKDYLVEHGIPTSKILLENRSTNTIQKLEYSSILLKEDWNGENVPRVTIITSEFHIPRTMRYLKNLGILVSYLPARTMPVFKWPAMFREFTVIVWYYRYTIMSLMFIILVLFLSVLE
ncbi:YdcF family protein [Companilactobacillus allii]|nr:YdcF family protein [Companilactobacillus allii]USQ69024.1 YdcF family protein [Companilactobacillus allii]